MTKPKAIANPNISRLGGTSVHSSEDAYYKEYRQEWHRRPEQFDTGSFPVHFDIEATSRCNLRCTFCDKLPTMAPEQFGDIDFDLYTKIIDQGVEAGLYSVKLSYRGEPLMHKRLADMVRYAKDRGVVDVYFNTNAMLLTEKRSKELVQAGLDRISISIEGTEPKAFEAARVGASFERIRQNVLQLRQVKKALDTEHPKIRIQTVALPGIDLDSYHNFWEPYCDETAAIDYKDCEQAPLAFEAENWACPQLWQRMTIEWDGLFILAIMMMLAGWSSATQLWTTFSNAGMERYQHTFAVFTSKAVPTKLMHAVFAHGGLRNAPKNDLEANDHALTCFGPSPFRLRL